MANRPRKSSPVLGAAAAIIEDASEGLIFEGSRFNHTIEASVAAIRADPAQARRNFDEASIAALAETLAVEGQLQPILLRRDPEKQGHWIIVAGERRWRAARLLRWPKMLAMVHAGDADIAALIENLQRIDLSPMEEARGIGRLISDKGWTQEQAAQALGKPKSDVSGTLRILSLPDDILHDVLTSEHPPAKNVLIEMARIDDLVTLRKLVAFARNGTLTVKAVRALRDAGEPPATVDRPAEAAAASQTFGQPWRSLRRAGAVATELVAAQVAVPPEEAASLHALRDALDRLLGDRPASRPDPLART